MYFGFFLFIDHKVVYSCEVGQKAYAVFKILYECKSLKCTVDISVQALPQILDWI